MNLDDMADEDEEKVCLVCPFVSATHVTQDSPSDASDAGSQAPEEDYDAESDNDYEGNYFDNGENDNDDLGDGGIGGDEGGGGLSLSFPHSRRAEIRLFPGDYD
jgi:DNA-directed RNA polymerase III subunit RPC7